MFNISELQKEKLQIILNDDLLFEAIELVFKMTIENFKPNTTETDNNLLIGEKYRAYENASQLLKETFENLKSYKKETIEKININRAI